MSAFAIRAAIGVLLLLVSGAGARSQDGDAWVWGCEEKNEATICQRWNIYGGDRLAAMFGCTGAMGGGVLVCRGRTVCEIAKHVTIREFHDTCEADDASAPTEEDDDEDEPDANADILTSQELEQLAQAVVEDLWDAENHDEKLAVFREYYEALEIQGRLNGLIGGRSSSLTEVQLDTMDISNILYWAFTDCTRARARLDEAGWLANRSAEHRRRAFARQVNDLVCMIRPGLTNPPVDTPAVQAGTACVIHDRNDTSANVRASPNGEIVNRLKNGRNVTIATVRNDTNGRPWMSVEGEYNGTWRKWGYVFGELLDCAPSEAAPPARPASGRTFSAERYPAK